MFKKMGIPGGIKRYLDNVIAAFLCKSHSDKQKCKEFVLRMAEAYPRPLKLNLTEFGDQDYSGCAPVRNSLSTQGFKGLRNCYYI